MDNIRHGVLTSSTRCHEPGCPVCEPMPACPRCGAKSRTPANGKDRWYCHECHMEFEAGDDGTIGYGPPDKRLRREERTQQRKAAKR